VTVLGAVYVALWLCTALIGGPAVTHAVLLNNLDRVPGRSPDKSDWCRARACAPFLVYAKYQFGEKPLNCGGGSVLCFWVFGSIRPVWQISLWAS
jgi:hypothetical protein